MKLFDDVAPCKVVCHVCGEVTDIENSNKDVWRLVNKNHKGCEVITIGLKCHHNFAELTILDRHGVLVEPMNKQKLGVWRFYTLRIYDSVLDFADAALELIWRLLWWV